MIKVTTVIDEELYRMAKKEKINFNRALELGLKILLEKENSVISVFNKKIEGIKGEIEALKRRIYSLERENMQLKMMLMEVEKNEK